MIYPFIVSPDEEGLFPVTVQYDRYPTPYCHQLRMDTVHTSAETLCQIDRLDGSYAAAALHLAGNPFFYEDPSIGPYGAHARDLQGLMATQHASRAMTALTAYSEPSDELNEVRIFLAQAEALAKKGLVQQVELAGEDRLPALTTLLLTSRLEPLVVAGVSLVDDPRAFQEDLRIILQRPELSSDVRMQAYDCLNRSA